MPTYSYRCADCGHAFDIHQEFTDDTLTICPNCGGSLRKVFGAVGVSFSGSGFYSTDKGGPKKPSESSSSASSSESSTSTPSTPSASSTSSAPSSPAPSTGTSAPKKE